MKILCTQQQYYIHVDLVCTKVSENIAATQYLSHLDTIRPVHKIPENKFEELNDLITSVVSILTAFEFEVLQGHQNPNDYTWYQPFHPIMNTGEKLDEYTIVFRISDHPNQGLDESAEAIRDINDMVILKSFTLGTMQYPNTVSILNAVRDTCSNLKYSGYVGV